MNKDLAVSLVKLEEQSDSRRIIDFKKVAD